MSLLWPRHSYFSMNGPSSLQPNMSLELTPSVGALECLVTSVGIWSSIGSSWERSSAPSR